MPALAQSIVEQAQLRLSGQCGLCLLWATLKARILCGQATSPDIGLLPLLWVVSKADLQWPALEPVNTMATWGTCINRGRCRYTQRPRVAKGP